MKRPPAKPASTDYSNYPPIRLKFKLIFSCLSAIPFLVFAYMYLDTGGFSRAATGFLVALVLVLILGGLILFRRMTERIEALSEQMVAAQRIEPFPGGPGGETKELAMIADAFNSTLSKLEATARELGVRAIQASTLNEIREMVSQSIDLEEIAGVILSRATTALSAQAGFLGVIREAAQALKVVAALGCDVALQDTIDLNPTVTLAGKTLSNKAPLVIADSEAEAGLSAANCPDLGVPRLLYLAITAKGTAVGILALGRDREHPAFSQEDVQFMQILLQQVAYSVENARLYENLQQSHAQLKAALRQQKEIQEQLVASARMAAFGELSVSVAHELNNPLTGIVGYADWLLREKVDPAKTRKVLQEIRGQGLRAGEITKRLLDFASSESASRLPTDVNTLLRRALSLAQGRIEESRVQVDLQLAPNPLMAMVDPVQMEQVFYNLIINGVNALAGLFMPDSKTAGGSKPPDAPRILEVRSRARDGKIRVCFRDNGPGMSPGHRQRVFEPFFSTQNRVKQAGLGLSVSYGIVKAHGGEILVESRLGQGSNFVVSLPEISPHSPSKNS